MGHIFHVEAEIPFTTDCETIGPFRKFCGVRLCLPTGEYRNEAHLLRRSIPCGVPIMWRAYLIVVVYTGGGARALMDEQREAMAFIKSKLQRRPSQSFRKGLSFFQSAVIEQDRFSGLNGACIRIRIGTW